jgi:hypothetical protein
MNKVEELVKNWKENVFNGNAIYTDQKIAEIAINCISLSKTWFDNDKSKENVSYEVRLYNNDGIMSETLHGITPDNMPETMMKLITSSNGLYSLLTLNSYMFVNGVKTDVNELGKLDIS